MKKFSKLVVVLAAMLLFAGIASAEDYSSVGDFNMWINGSANVDGTDISYWDAGEGSGSGFASDSVAVSGAGEYTVTATFADGWIYGENNFMMVGTDIDADTWSAFNGGEGATDLLSITKVEVDGTEVDVTGTSVAMNDSGIRINVFNPWGGDDTHAVASMEPLDGAKEVKITVTVNFDGSVEGAGDAEGGEETPDEGGAEIDLNGTYNAYLGLQTPNWTFRDAWNSANGIGSDSWGQFVINFDTGEKYGVVTDAVIAGNGTYTVSITDFGTIFADDFAAAGQEYFNLIYVNTDIPVSDSIEITNVELIIDGMVRHTFDAAVLDEEEEDYIKILVQNIWNDDVKEISYYPAPTTSLEIKFTVSGFAYDAEVPEEPAGDDGATDTPAADGNDAPAPTKAPDSSSSDSSDSSDDNDGGNTGLIIGIVAAVVVVCGAVVGVVVSKKKKK